MMSSSQMPSFKGTWTFTIRLRSRSFSSIICLTPGLLSMTWKIIQDTHSILQRIALSMKFIGASKGERWDWIEYSSKAMYWNAKRSKWTSMSLFSRKRAKKRSAITCFSKEAYSSSTTISAWSYSANKRNPSSSRAIISAWLPLSSSKINDNSRIHVKSYYSIKIIKVLLPSWMSSETTSPACNTYR